MVGITLLPEQIKQAPPEVRRWLEQQVSGALGLRWPEPALRPPERHLVACDVEGARAILSVIHGLLPVVGVFFELGREPAAMSSQGLRALRLDEIARHASLHPVEQVIACLNTINQAFGRVSGTHDAMLTALDDEGHCLVADVTARSILALWQEIVTSHNLARPEHPSEQAAPFAASMPGQAPYAMSMPAFTVDQQQPGA